MSQSEDPRPRVLELLKRYGREPTSFQMLEPGNEYWFGDDACVAYANVGGARVSVGEPVCAPERVAEVVAAFCADSEQSGKRVRFFHVSEGFAERGRLSATHIGEQPLWDPHHWAGRVSGARSLREQLRRARAKGVVTRVASADELADPSSPLRRACDALIERWLASRKMHELKFMVLVRPFDFPHERAYAVAEQEGKLVGFAAAVPIYARGGWFIEDLIRDESAPNGTAELLVDALMRSFADADCTYVTLGLAPLSGDVSPLLAFTRDTTAQLYNFGGVRAFKEKLKPDSWEPVHVAYPRDEIGVLAMRDVLLAFAPGGLVRFGLNTLVHQRTLATGALAILLVPWTLALAYVPTGTWFPTLWVQRAWVIFDLLLIVLMFSLVRRWRTRVAELVVVLTTCDALLTTLQVLWWNMWTAKSVLAWSLVLLGCIGPLLASLFFWNTRRLSLRGKLPILRRA